MKTGNKNGFGRYEKPEIRIVSNEDIIRTSDYGDDKDLWGEWEDID